MKHIVISILLIFIVSVSLAQTPVDRTKTITAVDYYTRAQKLFGLPIYSDTLVFTGNNGIDSVGSQIYVKSGTNKGTWIREDNGVGSHIWNRENTNIAINNGLTSIGGITLVDSTVTLQHNIVWSINGTTFTRSTDTSFVIPSADSGYYRRDLIYADSVIHILQGIEDTTIAIPPSLPSNSVAVVIIDIYGNHVNPPYPIVIGKTPTWQQTMIQGDTTTEQGYMLNNSGNGVLNITGGNNNNTRVNITNTNNGTNASAGIAELNDLNHLAQWYIGSENNLFAPDQFLIRSSGDSGINIATQNGSIIFQNNFSGTPGTGVTEMKLKDGEVTIPHYKNNVAGDSVLTTDNNGKLKLKLSTGKDSTAYHTLVQAPYYYLIKDLNGRSDTIKVGYSKSQVDSIAATKGTLTNFSFTNTTGITGTVTNSTTTPALSLAIDTTSLPGVHTTSYNNTQYAQISSVPAQFNPIAGTNITLTGSYPNITFNASGSTGVSSVTGNSPITSTGGATPQIGLDTTIIHTSLYNDGRYSKTTDSIPIYAKSPLYFTGDTLNVNPKVDTIWRVAGTDSIYFKINGTQYAILDSAGGAALTLTTTGTSGAATLTGSTLNIPQYSGGGSVTGLYQSLTATAGQTAFTFTLIPTDANKIGFYLNGGILNHTFYTISGNTLTLTSGADLNDVIIEQGVQ